MIIGIEWIELFIVIGFILGLFFIIRRRKQRYKRIENIIISTIRSKNGATLDDFIVNTGLSAEEISKIVRKLLSMNIIKAIEK
ncbi:MAG: hypothetical protein DRN04_13045, partial [Thermoprotei archaeon]